MGNKRASQEGIKIVVKGKKFSFFRLKRVFSKSYYVVICGNEVKNVSFGFSEILKCLGQKPYVL